MKHESDKSMLFYFLEHRNYDQDSRKLSLDMDYDLGDYNAPKEFYKVARDCAQLLRTRLSGVFDKDGNFLKERKPDDFGQFHKD